MMSNNLNTIRTSRQLRRTVVVVCVACLFVPSMTTAFQCPRMIRQTQQVLLSYIGHHKTTTRPSSFVWELSSDRRGVSDSVIVESSSEDDDGDNMNKDEGNDKNLTTMTMATSYPQDHFLLDLSSELMDPANDLEEEPKYTLEQQEELEQQWLKMVSTEVDVKRLLGLPTKPAVLPIDVLLGRTLDTIEDVVTHIRRIPYELGWADEAAVATSPGRKQKKTVVVLGSGWAAHAIMKVANTYDIRMIVVSPVNHFVFTPMLAAAAVGTVEYRSMTEAVRASNPMMEYIEGKAVDVNVEKKTLKIELVNLLEDAYKKCPPPDPIEIQYDTLICAVGTQVRSSMVPGAAENSYFLKSCDDSRRLRTAIGEAFEYASRPDVAGLAHKDERRRRVTFCIVGGGPTGVELAGELSDFFGDICKPRTGAYPKLAEDVNVVLIHGGSQLVEGFDSNLRDHALDALKRRGVEVRLNTYTTQVDNGFVKIQDKITGIEETLPVGITVWAAGVEPAPFCTKLLEQLPEEAMGEGGRIKVDPWMRPPTKTPDTMGSIFVLGDAASFEEPDSDGGTTSALLPQTAQVAGQQGAYVARLLNRNYNMTATPPVLPRPGSNMTEAEVDKLLQTWLHLRGLDEASAFRFLNLGLLAYIGGGEALSQIQVGNIPVFSYAGSVAFVLWRSVYLVKQVATRNRVLVTFDWIKTVLFGRDVTRL